MPRVSARVMLVLLGLAAAGAGGYLLICGWRPEQLPVDPRVAYAGPYRNIHPDVKYVGSETCGNCHVQIADDYARHAMGRSLSPNTGNPKPSARVKVDKSAHAGELASFERDGDRFLVERRDGRVWHVQQKLARGEVYLQAEEKAGYAIGSGARGHSYLSLKDGYVFQTPISWYTQKQTWDVSPGFAAGTFARRVVTHECLFCHANAVEPRAGTLNRIHNKDLHGQAIGCERCHGPGERHVADPGRFDAATGIDYTIVNPAKLPPDQREAVCQQCHLEGAARVLPWGRGLADFRPGLPLESCWSIFVHGHDGGKDDKAVNHVEQMYLSRCFTQSAAPAKLGCISCHDPHRPIAAREKVAFYRDRCLRCHADGPGQADRIACSKPEAQRIKNGNDCVTCHMPRYATSDIAHTAATDHRIVRKIVPPGKAKSFAKAQRLPIVHFHRGALGEDERDPARLRDLAVALVDVAYREKSGQARLKQALDMMDRARPGPADWQAWERKALALVMMGDKAKALAALQTVFEHQPDLERSLFLAGWLAKDLGKDELSGEFLERAIAINPWHPKYRMAMTEIQVQRQAWPEVVAQARAWIRVEPFNSKARVMLVQGLAHTANRPEAEAELALLQRLNPDDAALVKPVVDHQFRQRK